VRAQDKHFVREEIKTIKELFALVHKEEEGVELGLEQRPFHLVPWNTSVYIEISIQDYPQVKTNLNCIHAFLLNNVYFQNEPHNTQNYVAACKTVNA
jgi:hypothetical protein